MADRFVLANEARVGYVYHEEQFTLTGAGNQTADLTAKPLFTARASGRIVGCYLAHGENGADAVNPLFAEADVLINGVSALTTKPKLDKTAGTGRRKTTAAATGVTQAVINTAADDFVLGDQITVTWDVTRTTPGTEIADVIVTVVVRYAAAANA